MEGTFTISVWLFAVILITVAVATHFLTTILAADKDGEMLQQNILLKKEVDEHESILKLKEMEISDLKKKLFRSLKDTADALGKLQDSENKLKEFKEHNQSQLSELKDLRIKLNKANHGLKTTKQYGL